MSLKYKRILLKLSGEVLGGNAGNGYDPATIESIVGEIRGAHSAGLEIAIVIGGGNLFRGGFAGNRGVDRTYADYMGMLATVMNSIALQGAFEKAGMPAKVSSALEVKGVVEAFDLRRALEYLSNKNIVIFAAGTGNPFFTTDTAAALRAVEISADALLKGTKVDGVYSKDPKKHPDAVRYDRLSFDDVISRGLAVMDQTAFTLCRENDLPIIVFKLGEKNAITRIAGGENLGSVVSNDM